VTSTTDWGVFPGPLPSYLDGLEPAPGSAPGPGGSGGAASSHPGSGWEIRVVSPADYTTLLAQVPPELVLTFQFTKQLNDLGSGSVTVNLDDPWWDSVMLPDGNPADELLDDECLWQFVQDGDVRFECLGETIQDQLVDPSEQRPSTASGPGTIAALKWAMAAPEGFPDIVLKLDSILDSFDEVNESGNPVLDTNIWNEVSPSGDIYITPVQGQYNYPSGAGYSVSTLYPSGTLTLVATAGTTYLGATPYDATDTLISAQVTPVGAAATPTDANGNPEPYGTGLNGSELTQFYVQSLTNTACYALIGLSAASFYCKVGSPGTSQTHIISSAASFDPTNDAYWMITEQGGSGGGPGTYLFWTSPDGANWTQRWSCVHEWNATNCGFYVTATYTGSGQSAQLSNLNSNVTTPSYQGNIFLGEPIVGIWYSLLQTAQVRGTIPFVTTSVTATTDSFGRPWTDSQNVQITNGTDLYSLLQSVTATVNADYIMQPGFVLQVGLTDQNAISIGVDRSQTLIFHEGQDLVSKTRTRTRNQIVNLVGAENSDGHEISSVDTESVGQWQQREGWFQTSAQVDPVSMAIAAAAAAEDNASEVLTYTLTLLPNLPGKTIFEDFDVGDWIGLERSDFSAVDAVRVVAIAVQVDNTGAETHELTLQTYQQWLEQQLTYISNKLGGAFVNALGTTPVAPSRYGTGQVPTYFTPAQSISTLADVVGGTAQRAAPLVYNSATGNWQPAGTTDPVSGTQLGVAVPSSAGTVSIANGAVTVSATPTPVSAPDGGGPLPPASSVATSPTGTTVSDSTGTTRVIVGQQSDGTVTVKEVNGSAPAAPDAPTVAGGILGLVVGWDGLLAGAQPLSDFLYVQVHCSSVSGFTPSSATLVGTMSVGGLFGIGSLTAGTTYYVKLVALNRSRNASVPSTQEPGVPTSVPANIGPGSVPGTAIQTGTITSTQIAANAGITGSQLAANAGIVAGQVSFTARNIGGITTSVQATQPSSAVANDLWFNSSNGYQLYQYNGSAWVAYQYGTQAIAAGSVTAALIAANTITAAQIASGTITATQIAAGTIVGTNIAAGTLTATLFQAGIVIAGIINGTVVTGATLQNSTSNPRTSINPDGSFSITNSSGANIFKIGPDGTMYWYNSTGSALQMELQPGGSSLIYGSFTGPLTYDFEGSSGSTDSFTAQNSTVAPSSAWSYTGLWSLLITSSGSANWGATSPAFGVVGGTLATGKVSIYTPAALSAVSIGFTFWSGANGTGTNLGTVSGDQGTFATTAGGTVVATITGASVPSTAVSATFFVQEATADASGTLMYIDTMTLAGGLVYSLSPFGSTDSLGNVIAQGINFIGLPGLTNVFGVETPYGAQLAKIDAGGNISGQLLSAAADVQIAGNSVSALLANNPQGLLNQGWTPAGPWPSSAVGTTETALLELDQTLTAGRSYLLQIEPFDIQGSNGGNYRTYINIHYTTDGSTPNTTSASLVSNYPLNFSSTTQANCWMLHPGYTVVLNPSSTALYRFLVSASVGPSSTSGTVQLASSMVLTISDNGVQTNVNTANNGVALGTGSSGSGGGAQNWTENFYGTQTWSYNQNGLFTQNNNLFQGTMPGSSYAMHSWIKWSTGSLGNALSTVLGYTVESVTLRLSNLFSYYSTGMITSFHTGTTLGNLSSVSSELQSWTIGEGQVLSTALVPAAWEPFQTSGTYAVLHPPSSSNNELYYGYFSGPGSTSSEPLLTVRYSH
jgi:hypothetical protein